MRKALLAHPSGSSAELYLNGGQVTSWIPATGGERLFLSEKAILQPGKPIRGGIPVVFPQFADSGPLPKHGWLRATEWEIESHEDDSAVILRTEETPDSRRLWPHTYEVKVRVSIDGSSLETELTIRNPGAEAFSFTAALHSYLAVNNVEGAAILGLHGFPYIDKTARRAIVHDSEPALTITAETDRIYTDAPESVELVEGDSRLRIDATGFPDVVIWNPWSEVARTIADMRDDDYKRFICVEAAAAVNPITLLAGESWNGAQRLEAGH